MRLKDLKVKIAGAFIAVASAVGLGGCAQTPWVGDEVIKPSWSWTGGPVVADAHPD